MQRSEIHQETGLLIPEFWSDFNKTSFGRARNMTGYIHIDILSTSNRTWHIVGFQCTIPESMTILATWKCCSVVLFKLVVSMEWLLHSLLEVGEFPWWAIPLYTVCKSFWEPSKWKALYKYTLPPAASLLSTGDAFASLMYIVFHLGHCFYFYGHKRNIHSTNNNVNCIQEDIYLYIFYDSKLRNLKEKQAWHFSLLLLFAFS